MSGDTEQAMEMFDRRKSDPLMALVSEVLSGQQQLHEKMDAHTKTVPQVLQGAIEKLVSEAFPDSDPELHRRIHEADLKKAEARAEFWQKLLLELCKYGLLGFVGWAAIALWKTFLAGPS